MSDVRWSLHVLPLVAQVFVPIALLFWHSVARNRSRASALARTLFIAAYLVMIALAGLWLIVPWFLSIVYLIVLTAQTFTAARTIRSLPWWPHDWRRSVGLAATILLTIGPVALVVYAVAGRRPPDGRVVDLRFPLRSSTYYVANGGGNGLLNAHVLALTAERLRDYRGQSYGLDIVALNSFGMRASGITPSDPRRYVIFGDPIHSPCSGVVVRADDGSPDLSPPEPDRKHPAGNFVLLDCAGVHVLLGHMRRGTVRVRPGDRVSSGEVVGNVGNSGNTNEPHLHIHAQRPATGNAYLSGDPLPIRLDGRFLVRNESVQHLNE